MTGVISQPRQPQAQVNSCSGSSWMTSIRGKSANSGLRLLGRGNDFLILGAFDDEHWLAFRLVEQRQLRHIGFRFATKYVVA